MIQYLKNIFGSLDNIINPIAVKEMRQAVRSRYITLLLQLYLLVELFMTGGYLLVLDTNNLSTGGSELFYPLIVLLFIANLICVPVYTSNRLAKELRNNDAMFSTTLTPMQIVRGKFYCGLIISLLLFSAATPFVILTYLLRGLDISQILLTLYWTFITIQVFNCYGIVFGSLNINIVVRVILAIIMGVLLVNILDNLPYLFMSSSSSMDWDVFFISTLFFLFSCEAFMTLAACMLSPISFNRMTRPRIFITVCSLLLLAISLIYEFFTTNDDYVTAAYAFSIIMAVVFLGIGLCERTTLSVRQIQQIPRNPLLRILAFPFFTGVGSALVWFFIMFLLLMTFDYVFSSGETFENFCMSDYPFPFFYMILFYSTCGMLIRIGIDFWRHNYLNYRLPEAPQIVIYPHPQKGIATVAYTLLLMTGPTLIPLLFIFAPSSDFKELLFCFSPFDYLEYHPDLNKKIIPCLFGFFSIVVLIIISVLSFVRYYSLGSRNARIPEPNDKTSELYSVDKQG